MKRHWGILSTILFAAVCAGVSVEAQQPKLGAGAKPAALAQAMPTGKSALVQAPKLEFEKYKLPNGLEVILSEDHRLPMVAVNLWYHVGPANEIVGRTGFAHLFEHMMFQGSRHIQGTQHFAYLEAAGASDINGTTDFDRTNYFETLPANQLELALWLESDRMGYLIDRLDQANLTRQQAVVRNERRQSVENQPYGIVEEAMFHAVYPKGHPYYADVIGSHADVQAAKLEDVKNFFKLYYRPNNASLAIVGDFDRASAKALVEKYFGPLKRGEEVPKITAQAPPPIAAEKRLTVQDHVELPRVYMAWLTPTIYKPGDAEADMTSSILGGGRSSRLYKKLVYELQIAQDVAAQQQSLLLGSMFTIQVTARPGHTADEIAKAIDAELDKYRSEGPSLKEVERARNSIQSRIIEGLETLGGFGGVADRLNQYNHYLGNPDYLSQDIGRYDRVTSASLKTFAANDLKNSARVVVFGVPGQQDLGAEVPTPEIGKLAEGVGAESINQDEAFRAAPPKPGPDRPLHLPVPKLFKLANGLTVIYNERPGLPIVSAELVVRTGSDVNPPDRAGLTNFAVGMLTQGTLKHDALGLADEIALLGAELGASSNMDASFVSTRALKNNFPAALDLVAEVVLHPTFPEKEITRQRASRMASLAERREDPSIAVGQVFIAALYGDKNPYGHPEIGTAAAINAATRDDMMSFWRQNFVPNNAALIVAGNITEADLRTLAEKDFGAWQPGTPARAMLGDPMTTDARLVLVDVPGSAQTQLRVGTIGVPRSTPDFAPLEVMNTTLGGLFSSRINLNLREEHGYTYGAGSVFVYRRGPGPFFAGAGVRTDVTAPAVSEILKELHRMAETSVTPEELKMSKDSQVRSLPGNFETSPNATGSFANIYVYELGTDYYAKLPGQLSSVTAEQVGAVAKKYLLADKFIVVAVGDRAKIEADLLKLNLGKEEIRDADGNLIK